jgi:hypothetical protein
MPTPDCLATSPICIAFMSGSLPLLMNYKLWSILQSQAGEGTPTSSPQESQGFKPKDRWYERVRERAKD